MEVELIDKDFFGKSLLGFLFLEKREHNPIYWGIIFYKPNDHWYINIFFWNTDLRKILKSIGLLFK